MDMNKVISFLEYIASNAMIKNLSSKQVEELINSEIKDSLVRTAIQQQNVFHLESALLTRTGLVCGILPAEEPQKQPEEEPQKQPEEEPVEKTVKSAIELYDKSLYRSVG